MNFESIFYLSHILLLNKRLYWSFLEYIWPQYLYLWFKMFITKRFYFGTSVCFSCCHRVIIEIFLVLQFSCYFLFLLITYPIPIPPMNTRKASGVFDVVSHGILSPAFTSGMIERDFDFFDFFGFFAFVFFAFFGFLGSGMTLIWKSVREISPSHHL